MRKPTLAGLLLAALIITIVAGPFRAAKPARGGVQGGATPQGATVTGRVTNPEGEPIAGAEVVAVSARGSRGRRPRALTDGQGSFTITGLKPGTYFLDAKKEDDGYTSLRSSFHSAGLADIPQVTVAENQTISDLIVRLGPKGAKLTGQITDAVTGEPVADAEITLRRADNPSHFYSFGPNEPKMRGRFKVMVPPVPFTIEVKAPGYEDWTYSGDGSGKHADALQIGGGDLRHLTIALRPAR
jgi:protocatechuate 3,4-dioxygenase beta subunit